MDALSKIRQQILARNGQVKPCPLCNHALTIEKTPFFETELCENCFDHSVINELHDCCSHPELILKKLIISGGAIQIRNQCNTCGFVAQKSVGGINPAKRDLLPLIDLERKQTYENGRMDARCAFFKTARGGKAKIKNTIYETEKRDWFTQYNQYLQSPAWLHKRLSVLERDKYICQSCLDPNITATEVHHLSYEFVDMKGSEPAYQLVSVCHSCHENIEKMKQLNRQIKSNN